jgi:hypothetical protein
LAHEHADSYHPNNAGDVIMGVIDQVQDLRHYVRDCRTRDLHGLPPNELAAVHLPPGDKPHRLWVKGGQKRRRTEHDLVRLDGDDSSRRGSRELPRHFAPRKRDQKDSFDPSVAAADPGNPVFDL